MSLTYGLDIKVPTTQKDDDGWRPVMKNELARQTFTNPRDLFAFEAQLKQTNAQIVTRVVEITDYEPSYRL